MRIEHTAEIPFKGLGTITQLTDQLATLPGDAKLGLKQVRSPLEPMNSPHDEFFLVFTWKESA